MKSLIEKRDKNGRVASGNPMKGKKNIRGKLNPFFGKHHSEETKEKIRQSSYHRYVAMAREGHFNWKGGHVTTMKRYALKRDDYTCQICGMRDEEIMVVDHIKPKAIYPELSNKLENLQTLCPNCHARKTIKEAAEIARIKAAKL